MCNNLQPNCNSYKQEENLKKIKNQNHPMEKPYFNKYMKYTCDVTTTTMKTSVTTTKLLMFLQKITKTCEYKHDGTNNDDRTNQLALINI